MKDTHVSSVRRKLKQRSKVGVRKYQTTLDRQDLSTSEWLQLLQEELLDAACYVERLLAEAGKLDALYPRVVSMNLDGTDTRILSYPMSGTNICRKCGQRKEMLQDESTCRDCHDDERKAFTREADPRKEPVTKGQGEGGGRRPLCLETYSTRARWEKCTFPRGHDGPPSFDTGPAAYEETNRG